MRDEKRHGASGRALREAAIRYAASLEANDPDLPRAWEWLSHCAVRYAREPRVPGRWPEPRPEGRPRK